MTSLKDKMLNLLEDTVRYYSEDPCRRSYREDYGTSVQIDLKGRKCAIGRLLTDEEINAVLENGLNGFASVILKKEPFITSLKDLPNWFIEALEHLHDTDDLWTKDGLSEKGFREVAYIYEKVYKYTDS